MSAKCGPPLDKEPSSEEIKLVERMASIIKDFEARQLEVDEDEQLEVVEEEEDWDPQDELMDVEKRASSGHMITFSGGTLVSEERDGETSRVNHLPDFLDNIADVPTEYRTDWICELARENSERIMSATEFDSDYLTLESVQYIFTVCVRLRLPHEIRYLAILIFTRFMRLHTTQVFEFLNQVNLSSSRRLREWEKVEANLSRQTTLRMLSSIQIASKALSYHDSLSSKQVCSCLRSLGVAYTQRAALKSELRILKTLNFRLPQTPLVYSEALFKSVVSSWPPVDLKSVWEHTLLFLDIVFLHHEQATLSHPSQLMNLPCCLTNPNSSLS